MSATRSFTSFGGRSFGSEAARGGHVRPAVLGRSRDIDTAEVRESGELYYDQDGNQVYVQHLPHGRTNVTVVNTATGKDITSYETSTARVHERIETGDLWKLN
jgi:hypothetical protein